MPRVPYTGVPEVAPNATPPSDYQNIQPSPQDFGGLVAGAQQRAGGELQQGSRELVQAAAMRQDRFNQIASDHAFNQLQDGYYKLTYGDPQDPKNVGIYGLRGADALAARQPTMQQMDDLRTQIRGGLQNPQQQLQFDEASRRLQMFTMDAIGRHVDQQADVYGVQVNAASSVLAKQSIAAGYNDDTTFYHNLEEMKIAAGKTADLQMGKAADPAAKMAAVQKATSDAIRTRVEAWAPNDPSAALSFLKKMQPSVDAQTYEELNSRIQGHADVQAGNAAAHQALGDSFGGSAYPGAVSYPDILHALGSQESGHNPNAPTSVTGARGEYQLEPATFAAYAKPGEKIDNKIDNANVGARAINDLYNRFGGDGARISVGYFSGPGNVAPAGSPTPWKQDLKDPTGKSTSSYVQDVNARLTSAKGDAYRRVMTDPNLTDAARQHALTALNQQFTASQIALEATKQAQTAQMEQSGSAIVNQLIKDPTNFDPKSIADAPGLTWEQKQHLFDIAHTDIARATSGGGKEANEYGTGFWNAYQQVHAGVTSPGSITDASQLWQRGGPNGDLTLAGIDRLTKEIASTRKAGGDGPLQEQMFKSVHQYLSGKNDALGIPDPKGDEIFLKFMSQAFKAIDEGKSAGMTSQQLFDPDSPGYVGKLAKGMKRNPAQMWADIDNAIKEQARPEGQPATPPSINSLDELEAEMQRRGLLNQKPALPAAQQDEGPHAPY